MKIKKQKLNSYYLSLTFSNLLVISWKTIAYTEFQTNCTITCSQYLITPISTVVNKISKMSLLERNVEEKQSTLINGE